MSKNRILASLLSNDTSKVKEVYIDSDSVVTSASLGVTVAAGTLIYSSADTLPVSADNGDQALVTSTNRLYIYSNGGWYNIALINSTPYWSSEASSSYVLSTTGTSTVITILAVDSEGIPITYTAVADSDFNQTATITKDSDNGRTFTITPTDSENGAAVSGSGTVTFKASDGVNLVSTLSTFTLTFITAIENSAETTLLLKADSAGTDNQVDASTNNHTITEAGNITSTAFSPYHPGGYSTYFDGTGDEITTPYSSDFNFGTNNWTVEFWFYAHNWTSEQVPLSIAPSNDFGPLLVYYHLGNLKYYSSANGSSWNISGQDVIISPNTKQWYHLAFVRNGNFLYSYVDGVQTSSTAVTGYDYNFNNRVRLGQGWSSLINHNGYLYDVRVVNGSAVYTSGFTPPTEKLEAVTNTKFLSARLSYIVDESTSNHALTLTNNPQTKRFAPYDYDAYTKTDHGGSVYFDGAGDYLSGNDMGLGGANAFTIEAWMYPTVYNTYANDMYSHGANSSVGADFLSFGIKPDGNVQMFKGSGSPVLLSTSAPCASLNQWYHIAFVRESNNNTSAYVNGVLVAGPTAISGALTTAPSGRAFIGTQSYSAGATDRSFEGYMTDVRIVTAAVYTSAFTPPTTPLTAIANTQLLTCTNKNFFWDTGLSSDTRFNLIGSPTASNTQRKFNTSSSLNCGIQAGALSVPSGNYYFNPQGNFTVEAWFYWDFSTDPAFQYTNKTIVGFATSWDANGWSPLRVNNDYPAKVGFTGSAGGHYSAGLVNHSTWYHIAFVKNGNTINMYLDGNNVLTNTNYSGLANFNITHPMNIGSYNPAVGAYTDSWHGYIQDFKISQYVKYTANFTPPTTEFAG